ncbi:MAG: carbohydrate kinase [Bacteroidetes bacterium]|nr:carbohydrate kinase [Bacteroidota bacterium]
MNMSNLKAIAFGEVLWDMLPDGKQPGGAPMNVAYHLNCLGVNSAMISCIGDGPSGKELKAFLESKGIDTRLIQVDPKHPTGRVEVSLDAGGSPSYDIVTSVAWDFIQLPADHGSPMLAEEVAGADAFIFGSLACRSKTSRDTLFTLLESAKKRVFDVNLRTPWFDKDLVDVLMQESDILKMNDEELELIAGWYDIQGNQTEKLEMLFKMFDPDLIIMTRGGNGAVCFTENGLSEQSGFPVKVVDTIGSGDAFLAGFLSKYLQRESIQSCLEFACRMGAFVAGRKGATPEYKTPPS